MKQNHIEILKPVKVESTIFQNILYDHRSVSMVHHVEFLQFLQKLNRQKPIWNEARVSGHTAKNEAVRLVRPTF